MYSISKIRNLSIYTISLCFLSLFSCSKKTHYDTEQGISVKQFGAKGDGIQNDRNAFIKAFNSGKNIFVPKGTYLIETGAFISSNVKIKGETNSVILGMFLIDGEENIEIDGIEFKSWNIKQNYGIRITSNSASNVSILNCKFSSKSFVFQDLPKKSFPAKNIRFNNCDFSFNNSGPNLTLTAIHMHASDLEITNCNFSISGIDGCIKNSLGDGKMIIEKCTFKGDMDEEILDFYTFCGDVSFVNNDINISRGGVIRTKPGRKGIALETSKKLKYVISNNVIRHTGNSQSLVYIAGAYNLTTQATPIYQELICSSNEIHVKEMNIPLNFRGLNLLVAKNNTLDGEIIDNNTAIYISTIDQLQVDSNSISGGRIRCSSNFTPGGIEYKNNIVTGNWVFSNNRFSKIKIGTSPIYIDSQNGINISLEKNQFDFGKNYIVPIVQFSKGKYGKVTVEGNIIIGKKERKSRKRKEIVNWGKSKHKTKKVKNNN